MLFNPCSEVSRKLSAYLDGELETNDHAAIKEHLAACAGCGAEFRRLSAVDSGLRQLPDITPDPFFTAKVLAAARALDRSQGPFFRFLRIPVPAMAVMVAFIMINLFTFVFNINAMENAHRRGLVRSIAAQLVKPPSIINPLALARLCGECNKYMCRCMHEAGKRSICPCKDCRMEKTPKRDEPGKNGGMKHMEEQINVR